MVPMRNKKNYPLTIIKCSSYFIGGSRFLGWIWKGRLTLYMYKFKTCSTVNSNTAHSLSLLPIHRLDMTEILLKKM